MQRNSTFTLIFASTSTVYDEDKNPNTRRQRSTGINLNLRSKQTRSGAFTTAYATRAYKEGRGWKGDVKNMLLDISKLKSLGWKPKLNSK